MSGNVFVPTLRAVGAMLRDEWEDRGLGPSQEFDLSVMRLVEDGRDWRWLPGNPATDKLRNERRFST
jgi:hypothetical protein